MPRYLPIKELTTWTPRWVICGRVTEKGPVNTFKRSDGTSGKVGSVDIMDRHGDAIRAKFWGDAADKWMNFLQQGQVYTFSGGRVQVANKRYSNLLHGYELSFDASAVIQKPQEDSESGDETPDQAIPHLRKYNFTSLRDIRTSSREPPYLVDLLVGLRWVASNTEQFVSRTNNDTGVRRLCQVGDDSGHEISLTLFGDHTKLDCDTQGTSTSIVILAIQNVQIRRFRGLSASTLRTSHVAVNPDIIEAHRLREWFESEQGRSCTWKSLSETGGGTDGNRSGDNGTEGAGGIKSLATIVDILPTLPLSLQSSSQTPADPREIFTIVVEPTRFLYANRAGEVTLSYAACYQCNRKMAHVESSNVYRCEVCGVESDTPSYRYMFAMHLVDASGGRFLARTFHDPDASDMAKLVPLKTPVSELPAEARELLEREVFGDNERTTVSVIYAEHLDYTAHGRRLLTELQTLLPNGAESTRKRRPGTVSAEAETTAEAADAADSSDEFEKREFKRPKRDSIEPDGDCLAE